MADLGYNSNDLKELVGPVRNFIYACAPRDYELKNIASKLSGRDDGYNLSSCCNNVYKTTQEFREKIDAYATKALDDILAFTRATIANEKVAATNVDKVNEELTQINKRLDEIEF